MRTASKPKPGSIAAERAGRIRAWCAENKVSFRELSRNAGLAETSAQKALERLDSGGDMGVETAEALARAMGRPLVWLLYGTEPPPGVALSSLPEWPAAAAEAQDRFGCDAASVDAVGAWRVHERPGRVDAVLIAALARAWAASRAG